MEWRRIGTSTLSLEPRTSPRLLVAAASTPVAIGPQVGNLFQLQNWASSGSRFRGHFLNTAAVALPPEGECPSAWPRSTLPGGYWTRLWFTTQSLSPALKNCPVRSCCMMEVFPGRALCSAAYELNACSLHGGSFRIVLSHPPLLYGVPRRRRSSSGTTRFADRRPRRLASQHIPESPRLPQAPSHRQ